MVNSKPYVLLYLSSKPPMGPIILIRASVPGLVHDIISYILVSKHKEIPLPGLVIVKTITIVLQYNFKFMIIL